MAARYDLLEYDSEHERIINPTDPPLANLFAAADFVITLLSHKEIQMAFMGGFALVCHGSTRTTRDVDVVVNAKMKDLWDLIEPQPRLDDRYLNMRIS